MTASNNIKQNNNTSNFEYRRLNVNKCKTHCGILVSLYTNTHQSLKGDHIMPINSDPVVIKQNTHYSMNSFKDLSNAKVVTQLSPGKQIISKQRELIEPNEDVCGKKNNYSSSTKVTKI